MLRLVFGLVALPVLLVLIGAIPSARSAHACSVGPDFDPVAQADVIVGGRVGSFAQLPRLPRPTPASAKEGSIYTPVELDLEATHLWKGQFGPDDRVIDGSSLVVFADPATGAESVRWAGGGGACGALDADPGGMYVVLGLGRSSDGSLHTNRLLVFYMGTEPYDPSSVNTVKGPLGPPQQILEAIGTGPTANNDNEGLRNAILALGVLVAILAILFSIGWRRTQGRGPS